MAWTSGTATDYRDLLDRFVTFATTNAALVSAGQNWTVMRNTWDGNVSAYTGRIAFGTTALATTPDALPAAFEFNTYVAGFIEGEITVPSSGTYVMAIDGDDAIDLLIDGNLITSWYSTHTAAGSFTHFENIQLTAGVHKFRIRFVQAASAFSVSLGWQKPGDGSIDIVPAESLANMTLVWYRYTSTVPTTTSGMDNLFGDKHYILKAPGLSGTEQIFFSVAPVFNVVNDYYNWGISGSIGYDASKNSDDQPYKSTTFYSYLWNDSIPYWFIVNGNRAIIIAKVSNTYQIIHIGKILPYYLPTQYPYPVLVSATNNTKADRWSTQDHNHLSILCPGSVGAQLYYIDGNWKNIVNCYHASGVRAMYDGELNVWPTSSNGNDVLGYSLAWADGGYYLLPLIIDMTAPNKGVLGEVDGIFWVSGHQNASENIITVNSQDYLVVQNAWSTARQDYMAVRLA